MTDHILQLPGVAEGVERATKLAVDPRGGRLLFQHGNSNYLSVFRIENGCRFFMLYVQLSFLHDISPFLYPFLYPSIFIHRGMLTNPLVHNFVKELSFAESNVNGSILSVMWSTGHLLFYHLLY